MGMNQPDFMKEGKVGCIDCHIKSDKVIKPDKKICSKCHEKDYEEMVPDWKNEVKGLIKELRSLIREIQQLELSEEQRRKIKEINSLLNKLNNYPSIYVHNYDLLSTLLSDRKKELKGILK